MRARPADSFDDQVVLVTGAASGIGRATAQAFHERGAHVVGWDLNVESLEAQGGDWTLIQGVDVCDAEAVCEAVAEIETRCGRIDILVSNAGRADVSPIADCSPEQFRAALEINLVSHQLVASQVVQLMHRVGQGGCLLFNASKSAFNPGPEFGPYSIPKAGVVALMKQYAVEYGGDGIRANAVNADRVRTGLFGDGMLERRAEARGLSVEAYLSGNLLKREVTVDDVAMAFVALAQQRATTGAVLPVDGGNIAASPR